MTLDFLDDKDFFQYILVNSSFKTHLQLVYSQTLTWLQASQQTAETFNLLCNYSRMSRWHQFLSSWRKSTEPRGEKQTLPVVSWQSVSVGEHLNQVVYAGCLNAGWLCSREEPTCCFSVVFPTSSDDVQKTLDLVWMITDTCLLSRLCWGLHTDAIDDGRFLKNL